MLVGKDGQVWGNWWNGSWHDWFVLPGHTFSGAPRRSPLAGKNATVGARATTRRVECGATGGTVSGTAGTAWGTSGSRSAPRSRRCRATRTTWTSGPSTTTAPSGERGGTAHGTRGARPARTTGSRSAPRSPRWPGGSARPGSRSRRWNRSRSTSAGIDGEVGPLVEHVPQDARHFPRFSSRSRAADSRRSALGRRQRHHRVAVRGRDPHDRTHRRLHLGVVYTSARVRSPFPYGSVNAGPRTTLEELRLVRCVRGEVDREDLRRGDLFTWVSGSWRTCCGWLAPPTPCWRSARTLAEIATDRQSAFDVPTTCQCTRNLRSITPPAPAVLCPRRRQDHDQHRSAFTRALPGGGAARSARRSATDGARLADPQQQLRHRAHGGHAVVRGAGKEAYEYGPAGPDYATGFTLEAGADHQRLVRPLRRPRQQGDAEGGADSTNAMADGTSVMSRRTSGSPVLAELDDRHLFAVGVANLRPASSTAILAGPEKCHCPSGPRFLSRGPPRRKPSVSTQDFSEVVPRQSRADVPRSSTSSPTTRTALVGIGASSSSSPGSSSRPTC